MLNRDKAGIAGVPAIGRWRAAVVFALLGCTASEPATKGRSEEANATPSRATADRQPTMTGATPMVLPGLRLPPVETAELARVNSDEEVIGISVGGLHRAYLDSAMSTFRTHVINDLIGGVAVTVTFCDGTGCARAFTSKGAVEPLAVQLGGWSGEQMLLMIDGRMIPQNSDDIPLDEIAVERTTWRDWKSSHPDTDVFTGRAVPAREREIEQ
jgi:hypothetical protein